MNPVQAIKVWQAISYIQHAIKESRVNSEPVAVAGIIRAAVYVGAALGLSLTPEQTAALIVVAELVSGWLTRRKVTPVS